MTVLLESGASHWCRGAMMLRVALCTTLWMWAMPAAAEEATEGRSLAVWQLVSSDADASEEHLRVLTDYLANRFVESGVFERVVGWNDVQAMLERDVLRMACGADDDGCAAEIAGALGVRFLARGNFGRMGDVVVANFRVIDTRKVAAVGVCSQRADASEVDLSSTIDSCLPLLLGELGGANSASSWVEPGARWGSTALGVALLGVGGAMGGLSLQSMDAQADARSIAEVDRLDSEARRRAELSTGLLIAGGVVTAAAAVLWGLWFGDALSESPADVAPPPPADSASPAARYSGLETD